MTPPLGINEESGNWHIVDSTAGLWVELSILYLAGDSTPGHWGESSPGDLS